LFLRKHIEGVWKPFDRENFFKKQLEKLKELTKKEKEQDQLFKEEKNLMED
jgi:hypothetical protein